MTVRRVVITGLGAVTALGPDIETTWAGAKAGNSGIGAITQIPLERLAVRTAAQVRGFDQAVHFDDRQCQLLDRVSQLALVAGRQAEADARAGGGTPWPDPARAAIILAAAMGQETLDVSYKAFYGENAKRLHPITVPRTMPSAPASHLSMEFGLRGPCFSVASACASANHAIGLAFHMIRSGMIDAAMSGGSDASIVVGFMKAWDALRVLSPDVCRPFSLDRQGLVIGEAAAILVLEEFEHARARGADIHAEIVGFGMSADAGDITAPDARGAAHAMRAALKDAGLAPEDIDYVNAHGTGTRLNDKTEAAALADVFGRHLAHMPVSSTKSMHGHCLNAAGAVEAVLTTLALRDGIIPPTIGFQAPDPECPIDCVPNEARSAPIGIALSNSFAFGGLNAVLLLRRVA